MMSDNAARLAEFMERVWNAGDATAVDDFLGDHYVIHSDPGDPWDGKTLSPAEFKHRLSMSRGAFPDLHFDVTDTVADGDRVVISWQMRGTNTGAMGEMPPTGRKIDVAGMTIYYFRAGRIVGHRQVVDRLSVARQLGMVR